MNQESGIRNQGKLKTLIHYPLFITQPARGFTLIELLVVIAIVGLMSGFLVANFIGIKQRARDGQRKSDLRQIQAALELYRSDNASYPKEVADGVNRNNGDLDPSAC